MDVTTDERISRRHFLRGLSVGAAGLGVGLVSPGRMAAALQPEAERAGRPKRVLVLGAGLAGLAAAWELAESGHDVTILEARARSGGRVLTLRTPFADGLYAEAGAVAFSSAYTQANRYIDALGLERADWKQPDLRPLFHLRGRRFSVGSGETEWPYELTGDEQKLGPFGILKKYVIETLPPEITDPESWNQQPLLTLDDVTLGEYMRTKGASRGAVDMIRDTQWFGPMMDRGSALSSALADFGLFMGGRPFVLAGGNDALPAAMAKRLSRRILHGLRVVAIRQDDEGVEVIARRGDTAETLRGDRVICTLPATVLRDVPFDPELPAEKREALTNLPYADTTRTYLQVSRCFWFDEGVTGGALTDLPIQDVARQPFSTAGGPHERAILESHVRGPSARRLAARDDGEIIEDTLRGMEKVHPKIRDFHEAATVKAWSEDPHALAAYSWPAPGNVRRYHDALQRPDGRVHFAGEHTSILRGLMEGALRSGVRAANEVMELEESRL